MSCTAKRLAWTLRDAEVGNELSQFYTDIYHGHYSIVLRLPARPKMVSFWPWKVGNPPPPSYLVWAEKLTFKGIKALWTLYSSFAYLLYVMIVAFAIGRHNWGATEYTALAGGPLW